MQKEKYFIFIDESWVAHQDRYLWIGCLLIPYSKVWEYSDLLKVKYDQIYTKVKEQEKYLFNTLSWDDLFNFLKWRKTQYEMKFKNINSNTSQQYEWLISQYFKFSNARFCCLVIDKEKYPLPTDMSYFDTYINQLTMLIKNNVWDSEFVVLPDDITIPRWRNYESELYKKLKNFKKNCFWVCRLESHSNLFLQMVDILTGVVIYDFKKWVNSNKSIILDKVKSKLWIRSLTKSLTVSSSNYFSIWKYKK